MAIALAVACWSVQAATYPTREAAIAAYKAELTQACREAGAELKVEAGFVQDVDLNGDGIPDTVLSTEHGTCTTPYTMFSGSAGSASRWVVSLPDRRFETLDFVSHKLEIDASVRPPRLTVFLHGTACAKAGVETCRHVFQLDGACRRLGLAGWAGPTRADDGNR